MKTMGVPRPAATIVLALVIAAAVSGCLVVSINPWMDREKATLVPWLEGRWADTNNAQTASFVTVPARKGYDLTISQDGDKLPRRYQCSLLAMADQIFMQAGPEDSGNQSPGALLPVYMLFRIELTATALRMYPVERKTFAARATAAGIAMAEASEPPGKEDPVIVTASTPKLEKFLSACIKDKKFFSGEPLYSFTRIGSNATVAVETKN